MSSSLGVAGWIVGSVASSVLLILVNKDIMHTYNFRFVFTLTSLHFLITALGMELMACLNFFTRTRMPPLDSLLMAIFCIGSVAFMNFSLSFNTVSFYQVTKLLCIPAMVAIQTYFYQQQFPMKIKATLVIVLIGVALATVSDMQLNMIGLIMSALAVLFTAQFQIWQGEKQSKFSMNAMQMNHAQAFPSFIVCAILALMFDFYGDKSVLTHTFTQQELITIFISCVLALSVNLCTYGLIGKTSAVTYQVVGHAKTCLILLGGFIFFPPSPPPTNSELMKNLGGIFVALFGVIVYSQLKIVEGANKGNLSVQQKDWCDRFTPKFLAPMLGINTNAVESAGEYETVKLEEGVDDNLIEKNPNGINGK